MNIDSLGGLGYTVSGLYILFPCLQGYKGYQSIQASAGMDWIKLKEMYGKELISWAGVQCEALNQGTKKDIVRKHGNYNRRCLNGK